MKSRISVVVACGLAVASCSTTAEQQGGNATSSFENELKQDLLIGCRFVPTATAIANILDVVTPGVDKATKVAAEICKLVENRSRGGQIKYRGVVVTGSQKTSG